MCFQTHENENLNDVILYAALCGAHTYITKKCMHISCILTRATIYTCVCQPFIAKRELFMKLHSIR